MYKQMAAAMILSCACATAMADHGFEPMAAIAPDAAGAVAAAVGDVTGDGRDDVVVLARGTQSFYRNRVLLYAQVAGGFAPPVAIDYHPEPTNYEARGTGIALFDLDADGDLDIVVSHGDFTSAALAVLRSDGNGFTAITTPVGDGLQQMEFTDVDGDGHTDLIGQSDYHGVVVHPGDGAGGFGMATTVSYGSEPFQLIDMDGDGRKDLIHHAWNVVHLFRHEGTGFSFKARELLTTSYDSRLVVADFNGDDRPDMMVSNGSSSRHAILFYPQGDNGTFRRKSPLGAAFGDVDRLGAADVDGDGRADLLMLDRFYARTLGVKLARANGDFAPSVAHETADVWSFSAGDINDDGLQDVVLVGRNGGVSYLASRGSANGADLAVFLGLDSGAAAVRVENRGDMGASNHQFSLRLDPRLGSVSTAAGMPDGCYGYTDWSGSLLINCQMPPLAAGAHHQRIFPLTITAPAPRTRLTGTAQVGGAWSDLRPDNDAAMKSIFADTTGGQ